MFKRFLRDKRANVAMMFALVAVPLIAATGAAIDYSRAYEKRMVVQDALDAAALAANKLIGLATQSEIYAEALTFFQANTEGRIGEELSLGMVIDGGSVELTTELPVPTSFLGIVGVDTINFDLRSVTIAGAATYEVVLVLDNSGSMGGSKIATLKVAAIDLINSLFALNVSNPKPDPVRVGIVPFAASVNIGSQFANASWMDQEGIGPTAGINHDEGGADRSMDFTNRFDLFEMMDVEWKGCVEARPYPNDVTDATPTSTNPATLFQPMLAPDEPDDGYSHSYIEPDDGGSCQASPPQVSNGGNGNNGRGDCPRGWPRWLCDYFGYGGGGNSEPTITPAGPDYCDDDADNYDECVQERVCKYDGVSSWSFDGMDEGPNHNCTTQPLTAMSDNQSTLLARINAMNANGNTNIEEGIMWGWRLLSQTAPFSEGRPYGEQGNHKIMIVMTDGANTYVGKGNQNRSEYMAFNYIKHNLLGTTSSNSGTIEAAMNERTIEACDNLHQSEITVYTIAFQINDPDSEEILLGCASDANKAFDASNNAELVAIFRLIAQDIATLRVAE